MRKDKIAMKQFRDIFILGRSLDGGNTYQEYSCDLYYKKHSAIKACFYKNEKVDLEGWWYVLEYGRPKTSEQGGYNGQK